MRGLRRAGPVVVLACLALATGCGRSGGAGAPTTVVVPGCPVAVLPSAAVNGGMTDASPTVVPAPGAPPDPASPSSTTGTLTVLAAASLSGVFTTIAHAFEADHPGVTIRLSFDGSAALVAQLELGAPADLIATADRPTMDSLVNAGFVTGEPTIVATNSLIIAVPAGNPGHVGGLADVAHVRTVVCAPTVPCGAATARVSAAAGVPLTPVSLEQSVSAVAAKVSRGEADAGLVYRTDVAASGGALGAVALPDTAAVAEAAKTSYPVAVVRGSPRPELAAQFVAAVAGPAGQSVLRQAGFGGADS